MRRERAPVRRGGTAPGHAVELGAGTARNLVDATTIKVPPGAFGVDRYRDDGTVNLVAGVVPNGRADPSAAGDWHWAGREGAVVEWPDHDGTGHLSLFQGGSCWTGG